MTNSVNFEKAIKQCKKLMKTIKYYDLQIDELNYILAGVKGIDPSVERGVPNQNFEKYYHLIEKKDQFIYERQCHQNYLDTILKGIYLSPIEIRPYIVAIYINGESREKIAETMKISMRTLRRMMIEAIETITKNQKYMNILNTAFKEWERIKD